MPNTAYVHISQVSNVMPDGVRGPGLYAHFEGGVLQPDNSWLLPAGDSDTGDPVDGLVTIAYGDSVESIRGKVAEQIREVWADYSLDIIFI